MILGNVKMIGNNEPVNIRINDGKIAGISSSATDDGDDALHLHFKNAIVFPGLINSHDHLDFNLFPQLGDKTYSSYTEWGDHIHKHYKDEIAKSLKIPAPLRSRWGLFKNLLCGVTTVVNHGELSGMDDDLITVFEKYQCIHSVQFEKKWRVKLNNPFKGGLPIVIHVGEGDDWPCFLEIDQLIRWNLLQKKLIGVHAVIMSESQARAFEAIVWCPQSNYFLLNKTAQVNLLKNHTNILFGTDSTLTSTWDIWDHLHLAKTTRLLSDEALYHTINKNAANTWQLNTGELAPGKDADIVVADLKSGKADYEDFFSIVPADLLLVMHKGNIRVLDETLLPQFKNADLNSFSKVYINSACKYVQGDLPGLMEKIKGYDPAAAFPVSVN